MLSYCPQCNVVSFDPPSPDHSRFNRGLGRWTFKLPEHLEIVGDVCRGCELIDEQLSNQE